MAEENLEKQEPFLNLHTLNGMVCCIYSKDLELDIEVDFLLLF